MSNEGLLLTVKVFLDWLRTNTDLILMCAQVGSALGARCQALGAPFLQAGVLRAY